jgi:FkbM family methyltransferase
MKLKHFFIRILHSLLGFKNYLFLFSIFKIFTLRFYSNKKDYLFFTEMIKKDSNVIVIGANTGITTIPIAKKNSEGNIFAFEPVIENYEILQRVIKYFKVKNITAFCYALGNENTEAEMLMPVLDSVKSHGLCHIADEKVEGFKEGIKMKVQMRKLDSMSNVIKVKINFIKIVAQNSDRYIFPGARDMILKNRPVIYCELWNNENRRITMSIIREMGYDIKIRSGTKLINFSNDLPYTENFFFLPAESAA